MKTSNSLPNHVSSLATEAVQTSTHTLGHMVPGIRKRNISSVHSKPFFGNPLSLTTYRGYPDRGLTMGMHYFECPLSFKFNHVTVTDQLCLQRVDDHHGIFAKNEFGFNPDKVGNGGQKHTNYDFGSNLDPRNVHEEAINSKKKNEKNRNTSPDEIAFWSKDFVHSSIIAGETR